MSLLNPPSPIDTFLQTGRAFLQSPNTGIGIEFDDAVIALKRHSLVQLHDQELSVLLGQLGRLIRDQETELISRLFGEAESLLEKYL